MVVTPRQVSDCPVTHKLAVLSLSLSPWPHSDRALTPFSMFDVRRPHHGVSSEVDGDIAQGTTAWGPDNGERRHLSALKSRLCRHLGLRSGSSIAPASRPEHRPGLPVRCAGGPHRRCGQHRRVFAPASPPGQPPTGLHQRPVLTPPARLQNDGLSSSEPDISRGKTGRRQNAEIGPQEGGKPHVLPTKPQRGFTPAPLWLNPT